MGTGADESRMILFPLDTAHHIWCLKDTPIQLTRSFHAGKTIPNIVKVAN